MINKPEHTVFATGPEHRVGDVGRLVRVHRNVYLVNLVLVLLDHRRDAIAVFIGSWYGEGPGWVVPASTGFTSLYDHNKQLTYIRDRKSMQTSGWKSIWGSMINKTFFLMGSLLILSSIFGFDCTMESIVRNCLTHCELYSSCRRSTDL